MGLTRLNVYAGLAGFWLVRDQASEPPNLPGPAPKLGDPAGTKYYEIPLAIQDRSFKADGSFFYPDTRTFFDAFEGPFEPVAPTVPPVWNPEFFGNAMLVNGKTWPYLNVEPRKYRFRLLNGCNSRFLILGFDEAGAAAGIDFTVIGNEGGFFPDAPLHQRQLLLSPAERFDVIVDFSGLNPGDEMKLLNFAPDEPFKGWGSSDNGPPANPETTGQVMKFKVVPLSAADLSEAPAALPPIAALNPGEAATVRDLTMNEYAFVDDSGEYPSNAKIGTLTDGGLHFDAPVTETPKLNTTEVWRIINFTGDAHPIHLHLVNFQVIDRQNFDVDNLMASQAEYLADKVNNPAPVLDNFLVGFKAAPYPWETGWKETVTAPPGMVTSVIAKFDILGDYVWHCHIVEHEDNEMMRPFSVIP